MDMTLLFLAKPLDKHNITLMRFTYPPLTYSQGRILKISVLFSCFLLFSRGFKKASPSIIIQSSQLVEPIWVKVPGSRKEFLDLTLSYLYLKVKVWVVFHWAEFSARNDIFFCLLTPTLCQLVFKQKKMSLRAENSA